jgi:hypothetical protein
LLQIDGRYVPVPALLPAWDCETDLNFAREINVDRATLAREADLVPSEIRLELIVQWRVSDSLLSGVAFRHPIDEESTSTVHISFTLDGRSLGATLGLTTLVILRNALPTGGGPSAALAGSVLWRDSTKKVRLTGDASRLPITVVDFLHERRDQSAPWAVHIDGPLEAPAMGAVQLLLNSRRTDVVSLIEGESSDPGLSKVVRSALYVAVGRAMVEHALADDELLDDAEYDDETLGGVLLGLVKSRFGGRTLSDLRNLREQEPGAFSALIDGRFGLFDGALP